MPFELPKSWPPGIKGEEITKDREHSECHATESRVHGTAAMNSRSPGMEIPRAWNKRHPIEQQGHARDSQGPEQVLTNTRYRRHGDRHTGVQDHKSHHDARHLRAL